MRLEDLFLDVTHELPSEEREWYTMSGCRRLFVDRLELLDLYTSQIEDKIGEDTGDFLEVVGTYHYFKPQGMGYEEMSPFYNGTTYSPWEPATIQDRRTDYPILADLDQGIFEYENSSLLLLSTLPENSPEPTINSLEDNGWLIKDPIFRFLPGEDEEGNNNMGLIMQGFSSLYLPPSKKIAYNVDLRYQ